MTVTLDDIADNFRAKAAPRPGDHRQLAIRDQVHADIRTVFGMYDLDLDDPTTFNVVIRVVDALRRVAPANEKIAQDILDEAPDTAIGGMALLVTSTYFMDALVAKLGR